MWHQCLFALLLSLWQITACSLAFFIKNLVHILSQLTSQLNRSDNEAAFLSRRSSVISLMLNNKTWVFWERINSLNMGGRGLNWHIFIYQPCSLHANEDLVFWEVVLCCSINSPSCFEGQQYLIRKALYSFKTSGNSFSEDLNSHVKKLS